MKKNNKKGFTLIELLAVIVILAILATAAYTLIIPKINENKPKTFVTDISNLIDAYDLYSNAGDPMISQTYSQGSNSKKCQIVSVQNLIDKGHLKMTGNDKAKGVIAHCDDNKYYVSYTNGSYATTAGKMINAQKITVSDGNLSNGYQCEDKPYSITASGTNSNAHPTGCTAISVNSSNNLVHTYEQYASATATTPSTKNDVVVYGSFVN